MRVTLIHPPTIAAVSTFAQEAVPPLGLAYVAAAVRDAGYPLCVIDSVGLGLDRHALYPAIPRSVLTGLPFDEIVARIPSDTDVIGVSCMFSNAWYPTRDLLVAIRARLEGQLSARANGMAAIASASSVRPNTITGIL